MRLSGFLFAACIGLGLPTFLFAAGADLSAERYAALLIFGTAMGGLIPFGLDLLTAHMRDEERSQRESRDALTEQTRVAVAERWAKLEAPAEVAAPPDTSKAWEGVIETFLMSGEVRGFSIRKMQGVAGSDVWEQLTTMLADVGWLVKVPGRGYRWADDYTLARALLELRAGRLPYPDGPAPVVNVVPNSATLRNAPRQGATVIQGN